MYRIVRIIDERVVTLAKTDTWLEAERLWRMWKDPQVRIFMVS